VQSCSVSEERATEDFPES